MIESIGEEAFNFQDERFADIQMLRYRLLDFESLTIRQKQLIYCLSEATLFGRDITFDQFGKYNLRIRKTLEAVYLNFNGDRLEHNFRALEEYLKHVWLPVVFIIIMLATNSHLYLRKIFFVMKS